MENKYKLIIPVVKTLMQFKGEESERVKGLVLEIERKNEDIQNLSLEVANLMNKANNDRVVSLAGGSAIGLIGGMMLNGSNR